MVANHEYTRWPSKRRKYVETKYLKDSVDTPVEKSALIMLVYLEVRPKCYFMTKLNIFQTQKFVVTDTEID